MILLTILLSLFAITMWWRKRVWKRRFNLAISDQMPVIVNAFAEMWANAYREQIRSEWPDEIEEVS